MSRGRHLAGDTLATKMTPAQIADAQKLAREWPRAQTSGNA